MSKPLQYRISSWRQLPECLSNNSPNLHLHVADIYGGRTYSGFRITLEHELYGVLYAWVLHDKGDLVMPTEHVGEPTTESVLGILRRYGFLIQYSPKEHISSKQLEYLISVRDLKYDKIRVLNVWRYVHGVKQFTRYIVGFKIDTHQYWLNNDYSASQDEFISALVDGSAINITESGDAKHFNWDWLDYVASIDDIIRDLSKDVM